MHPRAFNLWIDAASFEFFDRGGDGNIERDRVLIQRALRLNPQSKELWLQCFALDLNFLDEIGRLYYSFEARASTQSLMPAKIVLRNAIKDIPDSVNFRLEFLRIRELFLFDSVKDIEDGINNGIFNYVDAWILQAEYTMQARKRNNINIQGKTGMKSL